ncbi:MAG: Hsp20/alpha crystallin family protein [Coriobacteriia bacterium]
MAIIRWDPFGEALRMQRDMDRIFTRLGQSERMGEGVAWMPRIDVKRSGDDVVVRAELPGMRPEDVDIELAQGVLTIKGERRSEEQKEDEGWLIRESSYGAFERSLAIPEGVDPSSITANYDSGVLEVHVPKAFESSAPRSTKIRIGAQTRMQMGAGEQQAPAGEAAATGQKILAEKSREAEREMVRTGGGTQ